MASKSFQSTRGCAEHELYNNSSFCYSLESRASGRTTRGHTPQVDLESDHKIDLGSVPTVRALSYASSRKNTLPKIRKQTGKVYCCIDIQHKIHTRLKRSYTHTSSIPCGNLLSEAPPLPSSLSLKTKFLSDTPQS